MTSRTLTFPSLQISFRSLALPFLTPYASNVLLYSYAWVGIFLLTFLSPFDFGVLNLPIGLCAIAAGSLLAAGFFEKNNRWNIALTGGILYRFKPLAQILSLIVIAGVLSWFWRSTNPDFTSMISPLLIASLFVAGASYGRARRHIKLSDAITDKEPHSVRGRQNNVFYLIYGFCAAYACYWWYIYATQHKHPSFIIPVCVVLFLGWFAYRLRKDENTETPPSDTPMWYFLSFGYGWLASILLPTCIAAVIGLTKLRSPSIQLQSIIAVILLVVIPLLNCLSLQGFWPTEVNEEPDLSEILGPRVQKWCQSVSKNFKTKLHITQDSSTSEIAKSLAPQMIAWFENLVAEGIVTNGCTAAFSLESERVNIHPVVKHMLVRRSAVDLTLPDMLMLCVTGALVGSLCLGRFVLVLGLPDGQAAIIQDFLHMLSMLSYYLSIIMCGAAGIALALQQSRLLENVRNKLCIMTLLAVTPHIPDWLYQIGHAINQ